jgi:hypothetical protein
MEKGKGHKHLYLLRCKNISQLRCPDLQKTKERFPTAKIGRR